MSLAEGPNVARLTVSFRVLRTFDISHESLFLTEQKRNPLVMLPF